MRFSVLASTTLASLAVTASVAAAQPANTAPQPLPAAPASTDAPYRELSPGLALGLSLGFTASGYAAFAIADDMEDGDGLAWYGAAAITLGPSMGHWYQEDVITRGLVTRAAGIVAVGVGLANMDLFCDYDECGDDGGAEALAVAGMVAFAVGTVDDIVSAPINANRRNRENRERTIKSMTLAPQMSGNRVGFALAGTF